MSYSEEKIETKGFHGVNTLKPLRIEKPLIAIPLVTLPTIKKKISRKCLLHYVRAIPTYEAIFVQTTPCQPYEVK